MNNKTSIQFTVLCNYLYITEERFLALLVGSVNKITIQSREKHHFCYEGPLGPYYQFWKGSYVEIFIGWP